MEISAISYSAVTINFEGDILISTNPITFTLNGKMCHWNINNGTVYFAKKQDIEELEKLIKWFLETKSMEKFTSYKNDNGTTYFPMDYEDR
jgi:hypothetical protein